MVGVGIDTNSGAASASKQYYPGSKSWRIERWKPEQNLH